MARNRQDTARRRTRVGRVRRGDFSPDGGTMYVNCYTPGTTFAVTGPWRRQR